MQTWQPLSSTRNVIGLRFPGTDRIYGQERLLLTFDSLFFEPTTGIEPAASRLPSERSSTLTFVDVTGGGFEPPWTSLGERCRSSSASRP